MSYGRKVIFATFIEYCKLFWIWKWKNPSQTTLDLRAETYPYAKPITGILHKTESCDDNCMCLSGNIILLTLMFVLNTRRKRDNLLSPTSQSCMLYHIPQCAYILRYSKSEISNTFLEYFAHHVADGILNWIYLLIIKCKQITQKYSPTTILTMGHPHYSL